MAADPPADKKDKKNKPLPKFRHIHCSSRFDRSADSLDADVTTWQGESSVITLTEVEGGARAAALAAQGWGYYNAKANANQDNCAICWDKSVWRCTFRNIKKLNNNPYYRAQVNKLAQPIYSCTVGLKRVDDGKTLLVSVTHFPSFVEANGHWSHIGDQWQGRKQAWLSSLHNWAAHTQDLDRKQRMDAQLIVADWNVNLKQKWVVDIIMKAWGGSDFYQLAWQSFPNEGGSLHTAPQDVPYVAPDKSHGDGIIDGSLLRALQTTDGPILMARVQSSDHRPFKETLEFTKDSAQPMHPWAPKGDIKDGVAWWGFGDYFDDEIFQIWRVDEEGNTILKSNDKGPVG